MLNEANNEQFVSPEAQQYLQHDQQPAEQHPIPAGYAEAKTESSKDQNFRLLRERAEQAERRNAEYERMIQANMNQSRQSQKIELEDEDDFGVADDSYVEGKDLKRYAKTLKKTQRELQETRQQIQEQQQSLVAQQAQMMLNNRFNDFDSVVSEENLQQLAKKDPVLFRSVMASNDIYERGYAAYKSIRNEGIIRESYPEQDNRIAENKSRPRASNTVDAQVMENPLARVGDYDRRTLTEADKDRLLKQVHQAKQYR